MRGLTSTVILAAVLAALVGYIYFVDSDRPAFEARDRVFDEIASEDIEELEIKGAEGEATRLRRSGETWRIVEPLEAEADSGELSSITSSLASLEIQRVVDENAADLKEYGLDPARMEVAFRSKDQEEMRRLSIGEKTPTGGDLYARLAGENRVFLVSSFLDSTFNKDTFALRDKSILKFERDKAEAIEIASGPSTFHFAKSGTDWRIVKPISARGDYGAIESIVERLSSARMQSIVEEADGKDLGKYGLDRPAATMTVVTGSSRATLLLGRTENALVFAKDAARPMIFTVAPTIQTDVVKELADYRRKDLFDARSFTTSRVELVRAGETTVLQKSKGEDESDAWQNAAGESVDAGKVEDLLSRLSTLRAESFLSDTHASLGSPLLTVTMTFDENKKESVTFGRSGDEVFARRADEPGSARLESASTFDEALKALDEMK